MHKDVGFTLLELMVVIFILSAIALSAVSFVDRKDHQLRYEDTHNRLLQIRHAMVGDPMGSVISGYVADMGRLPENIRDLIVKPANASDFGKWIAEYPDGTPLLEEFSLIKGWRGPYLALPPTMGVTAPRFRDGWGNVSRSGGLPDFVLDDEMHGWRFEDLPDDDLRIWSHGADGSSGVGSVDDTGYDGDLSVTLSKHDWMVSVGNFVVDVHNQTGSAIPVFAHCVRLLVYEYDETDLTEGRKWIAYEACGDGSSFDNLDVRSLSFPANTSVPLGRHLLVAFDGNDEPYLNEDARRYVSFSARGLPQQVTLVLR